MSSIKFSHRYGKLRVGDGYAQEVTLLDVLPIRLQDLSKEFLRYDTDNGLFKLPEKGMYLMLILMKPDFNICTTLRREVGGKYGYYKSLVGQDLKVEYTV